MTFRSHNKIERRYRDFPYTLCYHTCILSPIINLPHQSGTFSTTSEPTLVHHYHPDFMVCIKVHSVLYSLKVWKCVTCTHHYSIIQNIFTALNNLCALPIDPSPTQPMATTHLFPVFIILPFPKCYVVGIIQYITLYQLLSLSNMHLSFPRVVWWLITF